MVEVVVAGKVEVTTVVVVSTTGSLMLMSDSVSDVGDEDVDEEHAASSTNVNPARSFLMV